MADKSFLKARGIAIDNNSNCSWQWVLLALKPTSLEEAKNMLNENPEKIIKCFGLQHIK